MAGEVHVIGGGLAGSEAAWQLARGGVRGRAARDAPGAPDRSPQDRGLRRAGVLELVPLRRMGDQCGRPAARGDAPRLLADHGGRRCQQAAGRRRAGGRPRRLRRAGDARARSASADRDRARRDRRASAGRLGQRHRGDRPPHLARARARHPGADRRSGACLLRRHCPDRASRVDRHELLLAPVALRQSGSGRRRRRLHQLPARQEPIRGLHRRAACRRKDRVQRVRGDRRPISRAACRSR